MPGGGVPGQEGYPFPGSYGVVGAPGPGPFSQPPPGQQGVFGFRIGIGFADLFLEVDALPHFHVLF